jgi:hypothetical protein
MGSHSSVPAGFEKRLLDNRPLGGLPGSAPGQLSLASKLGLFYFNVYCG